MKLFLKRLAVFAIPIVVIAVILEGLLRLIPNDYSYKKDYLDHHASEIEVLFMGSSHPYFGVNPEFIKTKNGFNGAHVAQPLAYDLAILRKYEGQLHHLKFLVIPIDYFTLYAKELAKAYVKNYVIYYDINLQSSPSDHFEIINGAGSFNKIQQLWNYYIHGKANITCNKYGWGKTYLSEVKNDLTKSGKLRAGQHTAENNLYVQKNVDILKNIISYAKEKNVKIIFYTSPAFSAYVSNLKPTQLNATVDSIRKLSTESDNYYYNFLTDKSFHQEDFWDGDHLNEIGAKKLTLKLDSLIGRH